MLTEFPACVWSWYNGVGVVLTVMRGLCRIATSSGAGKCCGRADTRGLCGCSNWIGSSRSCSPFSSAPSSSLLYELLAYWFWNTVVGAWVVVWIGRDWTGRSGRRGKLAGTFSGSFVSSSAFSCSSSLGSGLFGSHGLPDTYVNSRLLPSGSM